MWKVCQRVLSPSFSFSINKVGDIFRFDFFFKLTYYVSLPSADGEGGMEDESRSVSGFLHFDTASKGKHYGCWLFLSKVFLILNEGRAASRKDTLKIDFLNSSSTWNNFV